jgi:hypothetical protein
MKSISIFEYFRFGYNYFILRFTDEGKPIHGEHDSQLSIIKEFFEKLMEKVRLAVDEFDKTLDAELKLRNAFIVTPKRFALEHLLKSPESLFASDIYNSLPFNNSFDFTQACICIAYDLPTAGAFHYNERG